MTDIAAICLFRNIWMKRPNIEQNVNYYSRSGIFIIVAKQSMLFLISEFFIFKFIPNFIVGIKGIRTTL